MSCLKNDVKRKKESTFFPLRHFAVREKNIDSECIVAFLDAFISKFLNIRQGIERTPEVGFPCFGIWSIYARFVFAFDQKENITDYFFSYLYLYSTHYH